MVLNIYCCVIRKERKRQYNTGINYVIDVDQQQKQSKNYHWGTPILKFIVGEWV